MLLLLLLLLPLLLLPPLLLPPLPLPLLLLPLLPLLLPQDERSQHGAALDEYRAVIALQERSFQHNAPQTLVSKGNLASLLVESGQWCVRAARHARHNLLRHSPDEHTSPVPPRLCTVPRVPLCATWSVPRVDLALGTGAVHAQGGSARNV